jgi:GTP-binding protein Era
VSPLKSGVVGVVGRPNVGKSTLVNALVGQKVAIVSDVPQTTRTRIRGILNLPDAQVVFADTPGFHKPRTRLGDRLNRVVGESIADVDVLLMVVDGAAGVGRGDGFVYRRQVASLRMPKILVLNKIDRMPHEKIVKQLAAAQALGDFDEILPVSAKAGTGMDELRELILARLPEGPALFPGGEVTDQTLEHRIGEIIREKAIHETREEIPHSIAVVIESIEPPEPDAEDGVTKISALVLVERASQKGMVIGKGGAMLKTVGTRAREELEALLGTRVYLELRVKVQREWQRDDAALTRLGY